MTEPTRANNNIVSIFDGNKKTAAREKTMNQSRARKPITVKVESVTARFFLNKPLWLFISGMYETELRDQLGSLGIKADDWYLSEDQSIVLMVNDKEFLHIKNKLSDLLLSLYRNSLELQTLDPTPIEEPVDNQAPSSFSP